MKRLLLAFALFCICICAGFAAPVQPDCKCYCAPVILPVAKLPMVLPSAGFAAGIIPDDAARYMHQLEREAYAEFGLNAPVALLAAQLHQESKWNANAKSSAAAQGLAQFMPRTAVWIADVYPELSPADPWDAGWSIRAQVRYMSYLFQRTEGATRCDSLSFALSSYNGGLGNLRKDQVLTMLRGGRSDVWADVAPYSRRAAWAIKENRTYVHRITRVLEPVYLRAGWAGERTCS